MKEKELKYEKIIKENVEKQNRINLLENKFKEAEK
jgi:hypothetical protein